jgi:hypothetical protein
MLEFTIGLDLAQSADFTALVGMQHHEDAYGISSYDVLMLERWRGLNYTAVPERVHRAEMALRRMACEVMFEQTGTGWHPFDAADVRIAVDSTGVGAAVTDLLINAGLAITPIVITGGHDAGRGERGGYTVPKKDLVGVVQVLLQGRRLRIAEGLPEAQTLVRELSSFRYNISPSGHTTYAAGGNDLEWRTAPNDDTVLAVAVACWLAEAHPRPRLDPLIVAAWTDLPG